LIISQSFSDTKPTHLFIHPIVVGDKNCIGLFGFTFKNLTVTWMVVQKSLRFEDKVYVFNANDELANKEAVAEFKSKYSKFFTEKALEELSSIFLKGHDSNVRYY
jgi:hypothetical protein